MVLNSMPARLAAPILLAVSLAGCVGPTQVKPMVEDPEGYSIKNFSSPYVLAPAGVLASPGAEPLGFKRLTVYGDIIAASAEQKPGGVKTRYETTYVNDGNNGAVRVIEQTSSNGLPSVLSFGLTYHGVSRVAVQVAALRNQTARPIFYLRSVKTWDSLADMRENSTYVFEGTSGIRDPLTPSVRSNRRCESKTFYDANQFIKGTPGRAIDLHCTDFNDNGVKQAEVKFVWLTAYNVGFISRMMSTADTFEFRPERMKVE